MKKAFLFWFFFALTIIVNGQDKMGFGNDPEGADSAGYGLVTTWVKPTGIDWTYEGVMTVGNYAGGQYIGYYNGLFGSIIPSNSMLLGFFYSNITTWVNITFNQRIYLSSVVIGSVEYAMSPANTDTYVIKTLSNPFPAVGQTCNIKLKYTLTP